MPRYYRKRYTRVVKPKKKWASNMQQLTMEFPSQGTEQPPYTFFGWGITLCQNATQASLPTPVIVKTGNFKVQADLIVEAVSANTTAAVYCYIMYLPESVGPNQAGASPTTQEWHTFITTMVRTHPEWIMGWKQIGFDWISASDHRSFDKIQFSSRLKRNLNSGDRIAFLITSTAGLNAFHLSGLCQFWTCAN